MKERLSIALLALLISPSLALCQDHATRQDPVSDAVRVDDAGIRIYLLGPGDMVDVRVSGQPDLSATVEVHSEGNISSVPFREDPIPAKCRNEKDVHKEIAKAYEKY